jgi:hypothetical protein
MNNNSSKNGLFYVTMLLTGMLVMSAFGSDNNVLSPIRSLITNDGFTINIPASRMTHLLNCKNEKNRWYPCQRCDRIRNSSSAKEGPSKFELQPKDMKHLLTCTSNKNRFGYCTPCDTIRTVVCDLAKRNPNRPVNLTFDE